MFLLDNKIILKKTLKAIGRYLNPRTLKADQLTTDLSFRQLTFAKKGQIINLNYFTQISCLLK